FVILKSFEERRDAALSGEAILSRLRERLQREIPEARVLVFGAPAVRGLGNAGGFKLMVEAIGDVKFDALQAQADNLAAQGNQQASSACSTASAPGRPSSAWTWTGKRSRRWGCNSPTSSTRYRRTWAASTSTTSTAS